MSRRVEILKTLQQDEVEPARLVLLELVTEGQMEEDEFWECWEWIEACREFHGIIDEAGRVS